MGVETDHHWMIYALELAKQAQAQEEVPVGAVLVKDQHIVGVGLNCSIFKKDPTAHAEIEAIRAAAKILNNYRLIDTTLYVTLEPCTMCLGAIIHARIARIVWGADDSRSLNLLGDPLLNHHPQITKGILAEECKQLLVDFFKIRRKEEIC